jgi:rod shape-determining protein MreC
VVASRRGGRSRFTLVLLILTSLTLLTLNFRGWGPIDSARSGALSALAPVGRAARSVFRPVGNLWGGAFRYDDSQKRNRELQAEVDRLRSQLVSAKAAAEANQELLALANIPFLGNIPTVSASVVSGGVGNFESTIELSKGSSSGIKVGQPVVVGTGLIGSVVQVSDTRSVVRLITDSSSSVGVVVLASGANGVATGQGQGRSLSATFDAGTVVASGATLVTAGEAGSKFPPELPVATVSSVGADRDALAQTVTAVPLAQLDSLSFVSVLQWTPSA